MVKIHIIMLVLLSNIHQTLGQITEGSESTYHGNTDVVDEEEEEAYYTPQLDYKHPQWCHTFKLPNGGVDCSSPQGRNHHSTLGTRCLLSCDRGHKLIGQSSVQCMPIRRWSGTALCRKVRCHVLPLIDHGTYSCTRGFVADSRCDYTCYEGYQIEGVRFRTCQEDGKWSGTDPICADHDPPKLKCPLSRVIVAEPEKLTARVSWDRPVAKDTADRALQVLRNGLESGSDFPEGINVIRYKVYDQARNSATCKFTVHIEVRRCPKLKPPMHGYLACSSDGNNYGAICEYHCEPGYERTGFATRVCQLNRSWSDEAAECVLMDIQTDVRSAGALLDQFYEKRRLLVVSTPDNANQYYKLQNIMLQEAGCGLDLRHVTVIELIGTSPRAVGRIKEQRLEPEVIEGLRQAIHISTAYFTMVLLDEYGVDRERFVNPTTSDELYTYIEEYLLTEEERERLEMYRDFCD
ncbi:sushi repeat-containing protein SRPX2-like isoform X1 [Myxocyprinus asiaticus]|uniref:sushi repeat-containing protein SRPX2-like isoform X1 n=1 Tax=Myxocyprinus asiaticus TaxID=70543 RepID=UPI0022226F43|nr:sushi repeat-containing protein SRPX2-like isoform X1 [Myxocyprinus asiaticus]